MDSSADESREPRIAVQPRSDRVCQACGARGTLEHFYRLRNVPAHSCLMLPTRAAAVSFPRGAIDLAFCRHCGFIGNTDFDPALTRYSAAYEETQAYSPRFTRFLEELCTEQIARFGLGPGRTALEIGCGKGEFLVALCERAGCNGIGLDPSYRPERTRSPAAGRIEFIRDFYGPNYAHLRADYICCRHTLEHIAGVQEFLRNLRATIGARRDIALFFELPDTERILAEGAFWDVYYEHCSYFTGGSLARAFEAAGFEVTSVTRAYDGQYLLLEARAAASAAAATPHADAGPERARIAALTREFALRTQERVQQLTALAADLRRSRRRLALWGSGSKCVSLLCSVPFEEELAAVVDVNPHKHGKFLAGSGREILDPAALAALRPDTVLAMNPVYTAEIRTALLEMGLEPELLAL